MAKTIKFNLICDDKPVRTIEDLQNNFSIEDVLEYYNNGLLHRWLDVRGYSDELEKIEAINSDKPLEIIKELILIFNISSDEKNIEEGVYMLEYLDDRKKRLDTYINNGFKANSIIDDYKNRYNKLVDDILENPEDISKIKANVEEIVTNYKWVLDLNHRELFWELKNKSILAIMCLLMNEKSRNYFIPVTTTDADGNVISDIQINEDKKMMFDQIGALIKLPEFSTILGENLITFSGVTDGYWKDLEPKGKKYMIISMDEGNFVRSSGLSGGDLCREDILNKFVILDGIDYKSNSLTDKLLYMEV